MDFIYYSLFLTQHIYPNGYLRVDEENTTNTLPIIPVTINYGVTGKTINRLDEIRTYNKINPYVVGVNGVTDVTDNQINYTIDGINFITKLDTKETVYYFGASNINNDNGINVNTFKSEDDLFIEKTVTENNILVERNELSVFENLYQLSRVNSLDDLAFYF